MNYSMGQFDLHIPQELIAQYPAQQRDQSRLLVFDLDNDRLIDGVFKDIINYIKPNDCIIYNNARVINARLFGRKGKTGAGLEVLLTRKLNNREWFCLIRPARRVTKGTVVEINKELFLTVAEKHSEGIFRVRFSVPVDYSKLEHIGTIPLPKYIKREPVKGIDDNRYQTVYSEKYGAVASPTAGLHFTETIMESIRNIGAWLVPVTLYVDWATFRPVKERDYRDHQIHSEEYEISDSSARIINTAIRQKKRIICIGTTTVRTVESAAGEDGLVRSGKKDTDLYIYPGYDFKIVKGIVTNFHMPDSTLILLVAAFAGINRIKNAYNHAVSKRYRFYSYGDAMFMYRK